MSNEEIEFLGRRKDGKGVYKRDEIGHMRPPMYGWWYKIKEFFNIKKKLRGIKNRIKWKYQKVTRGWSERDIWNLYVFHAKQIKDTLIYYKNNRHGSPVLDGTPNDHIGDGLEQEDIHKSWDEELDKMIDAFDKAHEIGKGELQFQPLENWRDDYQESLIDIYGKENVLSRDEVEDMFEGMHLYIKHFFAMWD